MGKNDRHAEFEVKFIENNQIKITKDDCSIVTEYIEEKGVKRKTLSPADIFFAAFALWATFDILAFCRKRGIATDNVRIRQIVDWNRKHTDQSKVLLCIEVPADFPKKYEKTIGKAVDNCLVANLGKGISQASFEKSIMRLPAE